ncbi:hypothetical protein [Kingella bonacorsii]|uniref:Uncharacterized protein n=1 Tax=Kingella bonacorsii TaxID=2796361 RepID=A0ABS1BP17_9NEIS|nr:hypothetical protein [Kingella bonacorsii]MBK0395033.1 hypothetical protein [Kingella bonacorsii]
MRKCRANNLTPFSGCLGSKQPEKPSAAHFCKASLPDALQGSLKSISSTHPQRKPP